MTQIIMNNLYKYLIWAALALAIAGAFLPIRRGVFPVGGVTNYSNIELRPEAANDGLALIRAFNFAGVERLRITTSGQIFAASGTTYLSNPVVRDRNRSVLSLADQSSPNLVTSTVVLRNSNLCENPIVNIAISTATGTLTLASSSALVTDDGACLTEIGDKFAFPITLHNASGSGNFVLAAGVSTSLNTLFSASGTEAFGLRATTTLIASSSGHLWAEFIGASSTGGNWIRYFFQPYR